MRQFTPVSFTDVRIEGDFWRERLETVLTRTIPSQHVQLEEHGILDSLTLPQAAAAAALPAQPATISPMQVFWDSDVGKWIEAASYALSHRRDADIEAKIDAIIDELAKAQLPDGYLNCWYLGREPDKRWTNLRDNHELYYAGHMLEGAIAYFQATGRRRLLDIMLSAMSTTSRATFGPGADQKHGYCGHQEIELALIKLYRLTGERKHLDLAAYFIDERGTPAALFRRRGRRARRRPEELLGEDLRVQPVAQAGARAGQGRRPRRARHVHVHGHGGPRRRARRRQR